MDTLKRMSNYSFIFILGVVVVLPILYIGLHSLKGEVLITQLYTQDQPSIWYRIIVKPFYINLDQYYKVFFRTPKFLYMFWNSLSIVLPIVIGQVAIGALAAYGFAKMKFPGSEKLFFFYIVMMLMPFQVTMVPNFIMLSKMKLLGSNLSLILPGVFNTFSVFFLKQFMEQIDNTFIEEGKLLGASELQILRYVIFPMCKPIITAVIVFIFVEYWSMVEQPVVFIMDTTKYPLSVYLGSITGSKIGIGFACSILYMILPIFLVLYTQNDLSDGLKITSLK